MDLLINPTDVLVYWWLTYDHICSVYCSHNITLLSSFMTYHRTFYKSYTTGVSSRAGTAYPFGAPELNPDLRRFAFLNLYFSVFLVFLVFFVFLLFFFLRIVVCLLVLFHLAIILSDFLRYMTSDYPLWYLQTFLIT